MNKIIQYAFFSLCLCFCSPLLLGQTCSTTEYFSVNSEYGLLDNLEHLSRTASYPLVGAYLYHADGSTNTTFYTTEPIYFIGGAIGTGITVNGITTPCKHPSSAVFATPDLPSQAVAACTPVNVITYTQVHTGIAGTTPPQNRCGHGQYPSSCIKVGPNQYLTAKFGKFYIPISGSYHITFANISGTLDITVLDGAAVSIADNKSSAIKLGESITFTATPTQGGSTPIYQWRKNNIDITGANAVTYTTSDISDGDIITCNMRTSDPSVGQTVVKSNELKVTVSPLTLCVSTSCGSNYGGTFAQHGFYQDKPQFVNSAGDVLFFNNVLGYWTITDATKSTVYFYNYGISSTPPLSGWGASNTSVCANTTISVVQGNCSACTAPPTYTLTGGGLFTAAGPLISGDRINNISIGLSNSDIGVSYQLSDILGNTGNPVQGTGAAISFGDNFTTLGNYTVKAINTATGCSATATKLMISSGNVFFINNPYPPTVRVIANPGKTIIENKSVTFSASTYQVGYALSYQWQKNGVNVGTDSKIYIDDNLLSGDVVTCIVSGKSTCDDSPVSVTSSAITMSVSSPMKVCVSTDCGAGYGGSYTQTEVTNDKPELTNGAGYLLFNNGSNWVIMDATKTELIFENPSTSNTPPITGWVAQSGATCNGKTLTVSDGECSACAAPSVYAVTGGGVYCGSGLGVPIGVTNSELGVVYQVKDPQGNLLIAAAGTGTALIIGHYTNALTYTVEATRVAGGCSIVMNGSATITSASPVTPSVSLTSNDADNSIASGTSVTFTATPTNEGTAPTYVWKKNDMVIANETGVMYTTTGLMNGDKIKVEMTSNAACASPTTATSTEIAMVVTSSCTFTAQNVKVTGLGIYGFIGSSITGGLTYTVDGTLNGAPKWKSPDNTYRLVWTGTAWEFQQTFNSAVIARNTAGSATNLPCTTTDWTDPNDYGYFQPGDMVLSGGCGSLLPPTVTPSVSLASNDADNSITEGTSVIFTATPTNGGTPTYVWKKNDMVIANETGVMYTTTGLMNGDKIKVEMTSSDPCASPTTVTSNEITMTVTSACTPPTAYNVTGGGAYCSNGTGVVVGLSNSETGVTYQLKNSTGNVGSPVSGTTGSAISFGNQTVAETYTVEATRTTGGCTANMTGSVTVSITTLPTASISYVGSPFCGSATNVLPTITGTTGGVFSYTDATDDISLDAAGTLTSSVPATYHIVYTIAAANGCPTVIANTTVVINAIPTAYNVTGGGAYCAGGAGVAVGLSNSETGVTYQLKTSTGDVGSPVSGTGAAISFGNQAAAATYTVEATRTTSGCKTTMTGNAVVTVNPTPDLMIISSQTVCNNTATTAVTFNGSITGTVYKWTNDKTSIGLAASGTGNIAAFTATNATTAAVTATITVTPTYTNGGVTCDGSARTFTITVNPTPTVNPLISQTVCNSTTTAAVIFSGAVTGTVYKWTNDATSIGLAASGTGNIAAFTVATNTGTTPITATITVTPSYTNGSVTCDGTAKTFKIIVNPTPTVNTVSNQTVCKAASTTAIAFTGDVVGTVYKWTNDKTTIGLAASGIGNIAAFTATNATNAPIAATITVTPTFTPPTPLSLLSPTPTVTCEGTPKTFMITVNPTATVNTINNQVVCNSSSTTGVTFSSPTTGGTIVYNWTNNTTSIGLAASGTGDIAAFTVTNTTSAPIIATITVTPSYTNNGVTCTGTAKTFTITVNPTPTVNPINNQVVCNNSSATAVAFSSPTTGGTIVYNWTNNTTSIGLAASGTGDIAAFTVTNTTSAPIIATITVTPSYTNNGVTCTGTAKTFTITVNPTAAVSGIKNQVVCNSSSTTGVTFSSPTTGGTIVYNWTNDKSSIGLAASGTGNIAAFTATNSTSAPVTATITVTPSYTSNGVTCTGAAKTFTITVNPTATINTVNDQTGCNNSSTSAITFSSPTTGGTIVYNWTNNTPSIGLAASGTGNIASFTAINTTSAPITATITVIPSYTNNGVTCTGTAKTFTITVSNLVFGAPSVTNVKCSGGNTGKVIVAATGGIGAITYAISPNIGVQSPSGTFNNLTAQTYTLTATDANGCTTTRAVTVGTNANSLPTVALTSPSNGAVVITNTTLTATASDADGTISKVNFYWVVGKTKTGVLSRQLLGSDDTAPYSYEWRNLVGGNYNIQAEVVDDCGGSAFSSIANINILETFTVLVTSPTNGQVLVPGSNTTVVASVLGFTNRTITKVEFFSGSVKLGEDFTVPYTYNWNDMQSGNYLVSVKATDNMGGIWYSPSYFFTVGASDFGAHGQFSVSGSAFTENNTVVNNVSVLANMNGALALGGNVLNGFFNITSDTAENMQVRLVKNSNEDATYGVTTYDIAKVSQHILNIETLATPYKIIAADVDRSGEIDATDMLHMRRFILRMTPSLPGGNFRFIDKSYSFRNPANPLSETLPEVAKIATLLSNTAVNFVAVKLGDVNDTYNALAPRSAKSLIFKADDKDLVAGNEYTVNITADKMTAVAFQGTFSFSGATIKYVNTGNLNNMTDGNLGLFPNAVTASWNGKTQDVSDVLTITFIANKSGKLSELLTLNSALTQAVANDATGTEMNVNLKFNTGKLVGGEFALYQNQPNPAANETTIGFNLPKDAQARLTVTSIDGRVVKVMIGDYKAGFNSVTINKSDLGTNGVFYYRLETAEHSASKKMVIIE